MAYGLLLRVTHTGLAASSIHISDVNDGVDVLASFRKAGAIYVPTPANGGESLLVYSGDVAISFETGGIRQFIDGGYLTAEFEAGDSFAGLLPNILDEGSLLTETPVSIDFVGAGVTATVVGSDVTVTIPGGAGLSHSSLLDLAWTSSGHTGTASRIAAFDGAGATSYLQVGVDVQAWDADLDAIAALAGTGIAVRTAVNTWVQRTLTGTASRITVSNGDGVSGNPTLDVGANVILTTTSLGGDLNGNLPNPTVTDLTITSEAQGTILYFNGTNWVVLPVGTSGQVLQTNGVAANPSWATPSTGVSDHTLLTNLAWTSSGHTGTASSVALFDGATGATAYLTGVSQGDVIYFDGTDWTRLAPGTSGQFLQTLGSGANPAWATPTGAGDVSGPGSSTDNALVRWDLATGTLIQDSNTTLDDTGNMVMANGTSLSVDTIQESTASNGVLLSGTRHYADSATDPASPAPAEGDRYYNTVLEMEMRYDGGRAKWLSVNETWLHWGRRGNTATGAYFEGTGRVQFTSTNGLPAPWNGTIVALAFTRDDTDSATVEVTLDGTLVTGAVLLSTATTNTDSTLNADFTSGGTAVLGVRNQTGGNTMTDVSGWVRIKWRI